MADRITVCTGNTGGTGGYTQQTTINLECGATQLIGPVNATMAAMVELLNSTNNVESKLESTVSLLTDILKIVKHMHDAHMHNKQHEVTETENITGYRFMPQILTLADRLAQEFSSNIDIDENGLIYGFDFIIDDTDPKIPPILDELNLVILDEGYNPSRKLTWDSYLQTVPEDARKE